MKTKLFVSKTNSHCLKPQWALSHRPAHYNNNICPAVHKVWCGWEIADMENVRNFTRAGLFVSRFYPKLRELRQF